MWTDETFAAFLRGELMLWNDHGGPPTHAHLVLDGSYWRVSLDARGGLQWAMRFAAEQARQQAPTAWHPASNLRPASAVPEGLGTRLVEALARVDALVARYEAGDAWLPQGEGAWLGTHPALGSVYVATAGARPSLTPRTHPLEELVRWSWRRGAEPPPPLTEPERARIDAACAPLVALFEALREGTHGAAVHGPPGAPLVVHAEGRFYELWPDRTKPQETLDALLFNPHAGARTFAQALERLSYGGPHALAPLPAWWLDALPRLREALRLPRRVFAERYLARLRAGGSLSGGPTTDQSWTVRAEGEGFVIEGYRPLDDGGYERTSDPLPEARLRSMLEGYAMFGLAGAPDDGDAGATGPAGA